MTIHVWHAKLKDFPEKRALAVLTDAERARAHRYVQEADRLRCLLGRAGMRIALGQYLSVDPATIPLALEDNRPPRILGTDTHGVSLSHSGEYILVGVRDGPIGVDIEEMRPLPDLDALAHSVFHAMELEILQQTAHTRRPATFFALWAAKEAYLKGIGMGLGREPADIIVPHQGGHVRDPQVDTPWFVRPVSVADGYAAAVAAPAAAFAITRHALF